MSLKILMIVLMIMTLSSCASTTQQKVLVKQKIRVSESSLQECDTSFDKIDKFDKKLILINHVKLVNKLALCSNKHRALSKAIIQHNNQDMK